MGFAKTISAFSRLLLFGGGLLVLLLTASASAVDAASNESAASEKVSVQLHWLHQFEFAGFYVAKLKGFYAEQGIDVDIREFSEERQNVTDEVLSGRADFAVGYSSLIYDYLTGKPVVALAALLQDSPLALLTREGGDINSLGDLAGRKVMIGGDAINSVPVMALLFSQGLPQGYRDCAA